FLAASRVEDRFGNWVAWRYSGDKLVAIESNDGRRIEIGWEGAEIAVASANGRTWNYRYSSNTDNNYPYGKPRLASVQQPDGHSWRYRYTGTLSPTYVPLDVSMRNCPAMPAPIVNFHVEMDHPTGATGAFQFGLSRHKRSGTPANTCVADSNPNTFRPLFPDHFDVYSIKAKTITGAGLAPRRWSYEYRNVRPVQGTGPLPCESCRREKVVVVKQPDGSELKQTFGTLFGDDNGRLLRSETYGPGLLRRETSHYISNADRESQPFPDVYGFPWGVDDASIGIVRPLQETAIEQDGETYIRRVDAFDAFARPAQVSRANSLNYGRYDRTERTLYHDNLASWVLGQPRQVDELAPVPGRVLSRVDFDARDLPWRHYAFGRQVDERTYLGDGSLSTLRDPLGHTTTLSDWKRGFPQRIQYADGAEERAQIDDNGWIRQVTDRRGAVRGYGYDAMGRLTSLIQPRDDEQPWNNTQFLLEQVGSAEYGIGGGHWRHTVSTGNARKRTLLDALWQPLLVESWDAADRAGTLTQTVARFDVMGRKQFASQPSRSIDHVDAAGPGSRTSYDALGRIVLQEQDSELGPLTTRTTYLPGNRQQVFNPRGQVTTTTFMAWDTPEQNHPVTVELPEGTFVDIERDGLGKPTAIRRRNADSTSALPPSVRLRRASAALQAD
ncbi:MAG: RHS repeat domain-containing protein, partial [Stenotrophomonas sp.]